MKTLIAVLILFLLVSSAFAGEIIPVPVEKLIEIRNYIVELQAAYNALVDQLNAKDIELDIARKEIERLKKRSSGFWLGAATGLPFPSAIAQGMYIINNNIGIMLNGGYSNGAIIQAGIMARIGE